MNQIPKMQTVQVDGAVLEYVYSGQRRPHIVLINGAGGPIEGWYKVFGALEQLGTVLAYNRPGIGGSSKPTQPQSGVVVVETLRSLLRAVGLQPPYVLVGHSLGGLFANLFARMYPQEVSSVVLLEATAPEDIGVLEGLQSPFQRLLQRAIDGIFRKNPFDETVQVAQTVQQIQAAGSFPDIPLAVVTGRKLRMPPKALKHRLGNQSGLVALSSQGNQIWADTSGHFPQFTQPDLVIQAIQAVV